MPNKMPGFLRGEKHIVKGGWGYVACKLQAGNLRRGARCRIHDEALFPRFRVEKPVKLVKKKP